MSLKFRRVALVGKYAESAAGTATDSTREVIADIGNFLREQG